MNLVLIGYRGTGKSAVGRIAARRLGMAYRCMDAEIIEKAGKSIPQIVKAHGWPGFRDLESELALLLSAEDHLVIDTGGGIIERTENMKYLKSNALVVWLKASTESIVARIRTDRQRPSLTEGRTFTEEVADVLSQRTPRYREAAHVEIDTDHLSVAQVAEKVIAAWRSGRPVMIDLN
jgi:shikimate kinase